MSAQKRIAAIHDISCFGRCSLTVALPIISAAGIETSAIPTAVLSTHTGGFSGYTFRDLTDDIMPIVKHWKKVGIDFDAIYTGYLGSFEQIDIISDIFDIYKKRGTFIAVDPVMGDHGKLYSLFPDNFPDGMKKLCAKADLIVPNMTEALLLLGESYKEGPYSKDYIISLLKRLSEIGAKQVVLTGVYLEDGKLGAASYDKGTDKVNIALSEKIDGFYHGTGDVFASALVAALMSGLSLQASTVIAVNFTVGSIKRTKAAETDVRFGVNFEEGLMELVESIKNSKEQNS
ncbi:MAG: pyridoxamine kinase [Eubacteriales bacterium]|nr:pyridoxamine kinase [Eubacteriales bacterium]